MATALDVITAAMKEIGALAEGEVPSAAQAADALLAANGLLDQWSAEDFMVPVLTRTTATMTGAAITVGTGGGIPIVRPVFLEAVAYVDTSTSPDTERPLELLDDAAYRAIVQKDLTSTLPSAAYYEPTFPLGTLTPWPLPTQSSLQWAVYTMTALVQIAATSTVLSLPPAYYRTLVKNLALELSPSYSVQPSPLLMAQARKAMAVVKDANMRPLQMQYSAEWLQGNRPRSFNIWTGQ